MSNLGEPLFLNLKIYYKSQSCYRFTGCASLWCRKLSYLESAHEESVELSNLKFIHFWCSRFEDLSSLKDGNLIIYVGANTDGADGVDLMKKCPHW